MDDSLKFMPDSIDVAQGETIRFVLTNSGQVVHEFQVGDAAKVAADEVDGVIVVEKDELDAGSTHAVDYTFDGPGPVRLRLPRAGPLRGRHEGRDQPPS